MSTTSTTEDRFQEYKSKASAVGNYATGKVYETKADVKQAVQRVKEAAEDVFKPSYHSTPANQVRPLKKLARLSWNTILTDDYCHSKLLTAKGKAYSDQPHPFTTNFKAVGNVKQDKAGTSFQIDQRNTWAKFLTTFDKYFLEARFWGDQRFRLFVDLPYVDNDKNYKPFATFRTNMNLNAWKGSLGINYLGNSCKAMTRLSTDDQTNIYLDEKAVARERNWLLSTYLRFSLRDFTLPRYDFIVGYETVDYDFYLSHDSINPEKIALGAIAASLIYRYRDYSFCTQMRNDLSGTSYTLGLLYKINKDLQLRAKIDDEFALSTAWRYRANNKVSLVLGTQWNLSLGAKAVDFSKALPFPIGLTFDFAL